MDNWIRSQSLLNQLIKFETEKDPFLEIRHDHPWGVKDNERLTSMIFNSHVYEINHTLKKLFCTTANEVRTIQLPFDDLFLDMNIKFQGTVLYGLQVFGHVEETKPEHFGFDYQI